MTIYVAIELADERFCDECPCRDESICSVQAWPACFLPFVLRRDSGHYIRPQACIEASAAIERLVADHEYNSMDDNAEAGPWPHITIGGKPIPEGGLADAIAEDEMLPARVEGKK